MDDQKIKDLIELFIKQKKIAPKNLRLFIIGDNNYLRIYDSQFEWGQYAEGYGLGKVDNLDRGRVLDFFAKLEFLINEIFFLKAEPKNQTNSFILDKLLEKTDLFNRISILKEMNIIDQKTYEKILKIKNVRNGFAHLWGNNEVKYGKTPLKACFSEFKNDAEEVWNFLEKIYKEEQNKIDFDEIFKEIESFNKN